MIRKLNEIWKNKGFEIILGLCIAFILIFGIYHFIKRKLEHTLIILVIIRF